MTGEQRRFHPAWILIEAVSFVKNTWFIIFFLFVLRAGENTGWILWAKYLFIAAAALTMIHMVLKWVFHTYEMNGHAFIFREGILVKNQRNIPFERIQNTFSETNFVHRMLGMTSLTLETGANDDEASVKFPIIPKNESARITDFVQNNNRTEEAGQTVSNNKSIYFQSTKKDNIKAAFTSLSFFALFPILIALYSQADDFFNLEDASKSAVEYLQQHVWLLLPLFVAAMAISVLVGYIQTVIKYGRYEISADEDRIYISKGTINTSAFSIQKNKVQAIHIKQSLIKRIFGMAEIKLISAGSTNIGEQETNSLYPFMAKHEAYELTNQLLPGYRIEERMNRLPKKVLLLKLIRPYYATVISGAALFFFKPEWLWAAGAVFLLSIVSRLLDYCFTSYLRNGDCVQIRRGGLTTETFLTKRKRIQQIEISHSWLQRKFQTGTLQFSNRAKPVHVSTIQDVPREDVSSFYRWIKGESKSESD
ncbi:PH domain-containing protein [Metabacillus sp. 113a]|uniref:PH domain-containing protein n=1 Tax=Metabacillus sp. 113a TaxID=3404706 RepID=UPI003CF45E00